MRARRLPVLLHGRRRAVGLPGTVQGALRCPGLSLFGVPARTAAALENRTGDKAGDQEGDPVQGLLIRRLTTP